MNSRRGFTLMEIMTALTITALVATLAASALRAGADVRERVQLHRQTVDAEARATTWLATMLRHAPMPTAVNEPMLTVTRSGTSGNDALTFLSQGVASPAGTGTVWRVTISASDDGLHIYAVPIDAAGAAMPMETQLPHITAMAVEVLDAGGMPGAHTWRGDWPVLRAMPAAVRFTLRTRNGETRAPLVFAVSPLTVGAR